METISSENSNPGKSYAVFFDLDHTLIESISGKALAVRAYRKGLMTNYDIARAIYIYILYKLRIREPLRVIEDMVGWVNGLSEKVMDDLCTEVTIDILLPSLFPEAKAEIEFHKKKMAKVVILSSSLSPVCRQVSKSLEMNGILCSALEVKDGLLTGRPSGQICYGEEKVKRMTLYCDNNNLNTADAWYYGDSISDLPALSSAGNPVCVNPERTLEKEALKRGWKILRWSR